MPLHAYTSIVVEPSVSAVSTSYSTRVLVSELTSIASTAASVMPVASSFGYPAVSEIYHTSITESNSYQSVKSVNSLTGYETTSSDSRTTSSRYRTDYMYSTTKSFSPQSSPNTTSSVYASRGNHTYCTQMLGTCAHAKLSNRFSIFVLSMLILCM